MIRQGEKNRRVVARFGAKDPEVPLGEPATEPEVTSRDQGPSERKKGPPAAAWIAGGLGVVALGSFAYFGLKGKSKESDLKECAPACPKDDFKDMKRQYLFADISLGVAAVSLGIATYLFVAPRGEKSDARSKTIRFGAAPTPRGLSVALDARF